MAWFALTVKLGDRTLVEHVQAIWNTNASRDLVRGTKEKVDDWVGRATDEVANDVAKKVPRHATSQGDGVDDTGLKKPMESVEEHDRKALRGLIGSGAGKP